MKTIEMKLYKINELSEESKKIAIEREKKEEKIDKMIESLKEDIINMNEQLKKEEYGIIESEETDEETEKRLLESEYYFYSDGSFYGAY